jgi:uncharacterized protein RhaS with RHS repeats
VARELEQLVAERGAPEMIVSDNGPADPTTPEGSLTYTYDAATTGYTYDGDGNRTSVTYADGSTTQTFYNAIGKVEINSDARQPTPMTTRAA